MFKRCKPCDVIFGVSSRKLFNTWDEQSLISTDFSALLTSSSLVKFSVADSSSIKLTDSSVIKPFTLFVSLNASDSAEGVLFSLSSSPVYILKIVLTLLIP